MQTGKQKDTVIEDLLGIVNRYARCTPENCHIRRAEWREPGRKKAGVSEIVGTLAIIGVMVAGILIVNMVIVSQPRPGRMPALEAIITNNSTVIAMTHQGGDTLYAGQYRILVDGEDRTSSFNNSGGLSYSDLNWSVGQTLYLDFQALPNRVVVAYTGSGTGEYQLLSTKLPWGVTLPAYINESTPAPLPPGLPPWVPYIPPPPTVWYNCSWGYVKSITINHNLVAGDLTGFPVLINISSDDDLRDHARSDAGDIFFVDSSANRLSHEIESYTGSTGALTAWVNVTSLSSTADTVIYMYYNTSVTDSQQDPAGVWDGNYEGVWHLSSDLLDSTLNNNDGTNYGSTGTGGKVANGRDFVSAGSTYIGLGNPASLQFTGPITVSAWISPDLSDGLRNMVAHGHYATTPKGEIVFRVNAGSYQTGSWDGTNHITSYSIPAGDVGTSTWIYLAGRYNGTHWTLFRNGDEVSATAEATGAVTVNENWAFGARGTGTDRFYDGRLDEVRISSTPRSADWIKTEYHNQNDPSAFISIGSEALAPCSPPPVIPEPAFGVPWYNCDWPYRKNITIDRTKVSGSPSKDFPVFINISFDSDLSEHAMANGYDIFFTNGTSQASLPYERVNYSKGNFTGWVQVQNLSSLENYSIFMYYGNPATFDQSYKEGVWNSSYKGIWHLDEGGTGTRYDTTTNANDAAPVNYDGNEAVSGLTGDADYLEGTNDYLNVPDSAGLDLSGDFTVDLWFSPSQTYSMSADSLQGLLDKGAYKIFLDKSDGKLKSEVTDGTTAWSGPSHNGAQEIIDSFAVYNGKLYAGQGSGSGDGDVLVFDGNSWSTSYDGAQEHMYALAVYNGKLYAGQGYSTGDGDVLVFDGNSWSTSYNGAQETFTSFAVYNGKLYAGQGAGTGDGDVLVFDGNSWSTSYDGAQEIIDSLAVYNGKLYAGQGQSAAGDGDVLVFDGNSWSTSYNGAQEAIRALAVYNGNLYAGQGDNTYNGDIFVFDGSSWSTSYNGAQEMVTSLAVYNGKLYAGQGSGTGDGDVFVFDGSSWSTSYNGAQEIIDSLAVYNGKLYAGQGSGTGDGDVYVLNAGSEVRSTTTSWSASFHHAAATKSGTTLTLYSDGTQQASATVSSSVETNALGLLLGKLYGSRGVGTGEGLFKGTIDEIRISNLPYSADWIKTEYNNQNSPFTFYSVNTTEHLVCEN